MEKKSILLGWREFVLIFMILITVVMTGFLMGFLRPAHILTVLRIFSYVCLGLFIAIVIIAVFNLRKLRVNVIPERGLYAVVRYPFYLSGILFFFFMSLWGQHWIVLILSGEAIACIYLLMFFEDRRNVADIGERYVEYMRLVPRVDPVTGFIRFSRRRKR